MIPAVGPPRGARTETADYRRIVPHRDSLCGGDGRCLRPIALGAEGAHGSGGQHKCPT